jgi:hypothetical protein
MAHSRRHKNTPPPEISALSTLLGDETIPETVTEHIFFPSNENAQIPMATKLRKFVILQNAHFFGAMFEA